ncbi:MAG: hypothetical protein HYX79_04550 [Chloroflexi bacterium]|nr:hypothetical protein [Chloroflexota bacterium]
MAEKQSCSRCGAKLNTYGICPNQEKHLEEDTRRHKERVNKKRKEHDDFDKIMDSVFGDKTIPFLDNPEPHKHVWEPYGKDKYSCKICGIIVFKRDLDEGF